MEIKEILDIYYDKIEEVLCDIPALNHGGCGLAALAIVRALRKYGVILEDPFRVLLDWHGDLEHNLERVHDGRPLAHIPHVVVEIGDCLYDGTGEYQTEWNFEMPITEQCLVDTLNHPGWNLEFERPTWQPYIEEELGIDLSDIDPWVMC